TSSNKARRGGFAMIQDVRYSARLLLKSKVFTVAAVLSLALGIGANTAIFSLLDAILLKYLPVERPEQLYFLQNVGPRRPEGAAPPYPCFELFRQKSQSFTGLIAFRAFDPRLKIEGRVEEARAERATGNYFEVLGLKPVLGRTFSEADDAVPGKGGPDG